jgi:hypothetical protein
MDSKTCPIKSGLLYDVRPPLGGPDEYVRSDRPKQVRFQTSTYAAYVLAHRPRYVGSRMISCRRGNTWRAVPRDCPSVRGLIDPVGTDGHFCPALLNSRTDTDGKSEAARPAHELRYIDAARCLWLCTVERWRLKSDALHSIWTSRGRKFFRRGRP